MAHQFEMRVIQQVQDVLLVAGEVVVHAEDIMPVLEQPFAEMRS